MDLVYTKKIKAIVYVNQRKSLAVICCDFPHELLMILSRYDISQKSKQVMLQINGGSILSSSYSVHEQS